MKKHRLAFLSFVIGVLGISGCNHPKVAPADTVLIHAKVYTVNPREPWAQALAVRGGKIVAVGSDKAIAAYQGPSTKVIDAKEHMVLPGFMDAHVHMMAGAAQLEQITLNDARTIDDFQRMVKEYAAHTLTGNGSRVWAGTIAFSAGMALPTKSSLTKSSPTVPFTWRPTTAIVRS